LAIVLLYDVVRWELYTWGCQWLDELLWALHLIVFGREVLDTGDFSTRQIIQLIGPNLHLDVTLEKSEFVLHLFVIEDFLHFLLTDVLINGLLSQVRAVHTFVRDLLDVVEMLGSFPPVE